MPLVAFYMIGIAALAALAWRLGDHRRASAFALLLVILPCAFFAYNYVQPPAGNHAMTLIWLVVPVVLYLQRLIRLLPAILGEFIALPYLLASLGLLAPADALWWGDVFGLTMVALIAGPLVAQLVGMAGAWIASGSGGRDLVAGAPRDFKAEARK